VTKVVDGADAVKAYLSGRMLSFDVAAVGQALPKVDPKLAADVVERWLGDSLVLARNCRRLPEPAIREVLGRKHDSWQHVFLKLAVPDDAPDLTGAWKRALAALLDCYRSYLWGSKKRRERFKKLARDPAILAAIQGTAANRDDCKLDMLAVLAADGSDASYDALIRHIDRAFAVRDDHLERLRMLRVHAADTPALRRLFAEIDATLDERRAVSPALALGPVIGVGEQKVLWFTARLRLQNQDDEGVPDRVSGRIDVDSRKAEWLRVWVMRREAVTRARDVVAATAFTATKLEQDGLKLGRCEAHELPRWLVRASKKMKISWSSPHVSSSLRGSKRERIASWLLG
jgi:hypothetical protein